MEKPAVRALDVDVAEGDRAGAADFGRRPGQRTARAGKPSSVAVAFSVTDAGSVMV